MSDPTRSFVFTIGFDLDMTLVDSSAGITHCMDFILTKHGITHITTQEMKNTIGVPLRDAFLVWIPDEERCDAVVAEYRAIFDEIALPKITLLPGALDALQAVHASGGQVLIVSSRMEASIHSILKCVICCVLSVFAISSLLSLLVVWLCVHVWLCPLALLGGITQLFNLQLQRFS